MDWNEETIACLRQFWQDGHSTAEIGRRMGITKNAVVGKAHRLTLSPRPSPIRRDLPEGHVPRRSAPRRATGPTLPAPNLPSVTASVPPAALAVPDPVAPPHMPSPQAPMQLRAVPAPRTGVRAATCCWPIGDPGTANFRFCDDGAMTGKPYCAQHAALAYVKVRDRREDAA
jgi:GcrA cell cycle regulator